MLQANQIFRNWEVDGVPSSGLHNPELAEIRTWGTWLESFVAASGSNAGSVFETKSALDGNLARVADSMAWVISDPVTANNGIYRKLGASGSGSWARAGDLPYSFVSLTDAGAGTANAIQLTSTIPTSPSVLRTANIFEANTGNVTVSENGGSARPLVTNSGNQIAPGGLLANMMIVYVDDGVNFRLLSDQASAAIVAAAEAAQAAAEAARDAALAAVPSVFALSRTVLKAIDTTLVTAAFLKEAGREGQFLWKTGDFSALIAADTTEAIYIKANAIAATAGAWVRVYDGLNINTNWCGGNWQAAIDLAAVLSVPTVTPVGTYTATSGTGALKMRAGVTLHNFAGTATLTQANGAQLSNLLDFATYAAHGSKVINITIDGNRANNTDDIASKHLILIYDANDVVLQGCTITGSNGNGILIRDGVRAKILKNSISNVYVLPVAIGRSVKGNAFHEISDNTISGEWGQHGIVVKYANYCVVRRNSITGQRLGTFTINITGGNTIVSQSGNYFTPASVGKFLIFNSGIERLISGYVNPTTVVVSVGGLSGSGLTAVWGNGDVISIQGSDDCDVSENGVFGSASLGISIFSDGTNSANRNRIYKNRIASHGSAGISLQNIAGTFVLSTAIEGNVVIDCGLNLAAGDNSYNVGISCRGGANTQRVAVIGNQIEGYITPATMDYGIAFDVAVVNKFNSGNWINGTVGGKTIQNP